MKNPLFKKKLEEAVKKIENERKWYCIRCGKQLHSQFDMLCPTCEEYLANEQVARRLQTP